MAKRRRPAAGRRPSPRRPPAPRTEPEARRSVIVTFKRKDVRPDQSTDKLDIVRQLVQQDVRFFDTRMMPGGADVIPTGMPRELVGFDINEYEAPIVVASLTEAEIRRLRSDGNIAQVEDDGECYALHGPFPGQGVAFAPSAGYAPWAPSQPDSFVIEGQPSVLAETVPAGVSQVKAPLAWDASKGKGIKVAVLDTGIDNTHPDLTANFRGGVSFVPGETPMDGNSHGTHCAGTIAAAINNAGVIGVAPAAYLYAVKVLSNSGSGNWSWLIAGLDWCIKNGIKVASMSLGGGGAPTALRTMCDTAFARGVLLVAAAGNSGPGMGTVGEPAAYPSVVAVSAIDSANVIAPFSSRGPEVELCAPGVDVLSTIPGGGYGRKSGTSMACPHVSGVAAVAWGAHRYATNVTMRRLLAYTSDNLGLPGRDPLFGFGRADAEQAAMSLTAPPAVPGIP